MDTQKQKKGCEITVESKPHDVNDNGVREEPAKYMANKPAGFLKAIKRLFKKEE